MEKHTTTQSLQQASKQQPLDSHKLDSKAISLGIVSIKLLLERSKSTVEWKNDKQA
jgi:hypothetical protein